MGKERIFAAAPARLIGDNRLSALEIRCLLAIAIHDGMSKTKGNGAGCFAKSATMAAEVGTDVTNFSKALSRLVALGYVVREPQLMDKRRFTLRLVYAPDTCRDDQQSPGALVGEMTNNPAEIVGENANDRAKVVGDGESENGRFSKRNGVDYIPLNGELNSVETEIINSGEPAPFADREKRPGSEEAIQRGAGAKRGASPARGKTTLRDLLPENFTKLPLGAQMQRIEQGLDSIGRDPKRLHPDAFRALTKFLEATVFDSLADNEAVAAHAERIYLEISP